MVADPLKVPTVVEFELQLFIGDLGNSSINADKDDKTNVLCMKSENCDNDGNFFFKIKFNDPNN